MKLRRIVSVVTIVTIISNCLLGCAKMESAQQTISQTAGAVQSAVIDWYNHIDPDEFQRGWDIVVQQASATYNSTTVSEHVSDVAKDVAKEINVLKESINSVKGSKRGIAQEAGYAAERWAEGTFNIDAIAKGSLERAKRLNSNKNASVDVETAYEKASLKYYNSASESAKAQAKTVLEDYAKKNKKSPLSLKEYGDKYGYGTSDKEALFASVYYGQTRIIPSDQMEEAQKYLKGRISELSKIDGDVSKARVKSLEETLNSLRDRLVSPDGVQSKPLTYAEAQAIAELAEKGEFTPEQFHVSIADIITPKLILKQALGAGIQTAVLEVVLSVGPEIYDLLVKAYNDEEILKEEVKNAGIDAVIMGSSGMIEGTVACALVQAFKTGRFGVDHMEASPMLIATMTTLMVNVIRYGYYLNKGKITAGDYGNMIAEDIIATIGYSMANAALSTLLPDLSIVILTGSLIGGMIAVAGFEVAKEFIFDVKDAGCFEAILPVDNEGFISVARDKIASMNIKETVNGTRDMVVETVSDGYLKIVMR